MNGTADGQTTPETTTTTGAAAATPAPTGQSGATTGAISMTREELDRQLAEARKSTERSVRDSQELKDLKAKAQRLDELEEKSKTAEEKLLDRATKAESFAQTYQRKYREALIRSEFVTQAIASGIPHDRVDDAFRLADLADVALDEETDMVKGADKAVKRLVESKPWLVDAPAAAQGANGRRPAANINAGERTRELTNEQQIEQLVQEGRRNRAYLGL